jgi:hypothetical protein
MKAKDKSAEIVIDALQEGATDLWLVGRSPIILNRLAEKARQTLLYPVGRKSTGERARSLKHNPMQEFLAAPHRLAEGPTLLAIPGSAPKLAMAKAALDIPNVQKSQIGRLVYVPAERLPVYGKPQIILSVVRSADINKTPDIRTRCIVAEWAIPLQICYATPILSQAAIINLLTYAGRYVGIGDWRSEKGNGNYGQFSPITISEGKKLKHILKWDRRAQLEEMAAPSSYDEETNELLAWFNNEVTVRGQTERLTIAKDDDHDEDETSAAA